MLEKIEAIARDQCYLDPRKPVLAGISGGPDSLCLMDILHRAGYQVIVVHFNHKLRPEADAEATAVKEAAARLKLAFAVESADVGLYARQKKLSIEEAARELRYRSLFAQARRHQAQAVVVGHTADDQVETVLMHFIRGAGLNGLKGMQYRTLLPAFDPEIPIVRPLLDIWREETVAYCASHDLQPHYDPSNDSLEFLRNRLRHELIPVLEMYNPRFREVIWRSAQTLSSDHALLIEALESWRQKCVIRETDDYVALNLNFLCAHSVGLQRHLIRGAVERLAPGQETVYAVLERAAAFITDSARLRMDLIGGLVLLREGGALYIARSEVELPFDCWPQMPVETDSIEVSVPGEMVLSAGWRFSSERWRIPESAWGESSRNEDRFRVWLDADGLPDKLELRVRRAGDLFEPFGLKGHSQKLSDLFINVKLPRRARERWPLLCAKDKVVWVPGYRPTESFKLKESSRNVVFFALMPPFEKKT